MTPSQPQQHCGHECVCTTFGLVPLWMKKEYVICPNRCEHDTRLLPPPITLTHPLAQHYAERSQATGKPVQVLVLQDLAELHKKRVAREESRVFRENEFERL